MNNFKLVNCDTDSIMVCKLDGSPFSEQEQATLLKELNEQFPDKIRWEPDGYFPRVVVLKAKNYVLFDGKKIKTKGSSIRDPKREPALKEFLDKIIESIIKDKNDYQEIYNSYAKEILNITDISRYRTKKTVSDKVLNPERTNEQKILDAIRGTEYSEGDKIYLYYDSDNNLKLIEHWDGNYNKEKYLKRLYDTALIFESVINKDVFINYSLKRNHKLWDNL